VKASFSHVCRCTTPASNVKSIKKLANIFARYMFGILRKQRNYDQRKTTDSDACFMNMLRAASNKTAKDFTAEWAGLFG